MLTKINAEINRIRREAHKRVDELLDEMLQLTKEETTPQ